MIGSETVDLLIYRTKLDPKIWEKRPEGYFLAEHGSWSVTLNVRGPVPELILEQRPGHYKGGIPRVHRATDLDPQLCNQDGVLQYWIATLLDKVTLGATPARKTIEATNQEGVKRGLQVSL